MVSALEKWIDEPTFRLINVLTVSESKPFSEKHYIADWYLDKNGYSLYCIRATENRRVHFYIQLRNVAGKWKAMRPEIMRAWRRK